MTTAPRPIPIRAQHADPKIHLERAGYAAAWAVANGYDSQDGHRLYPDDSAVKILLRAAVTPAETGGTGAALAEHATGAFLDSVASASAASALRPLGTVVDLGQSLDITYPARASTPTAMPFVGEDQPIPVNREAVAGIAIAPKKMGVIVPFTGQLAKRGRALGAFTSMLREQAALSLDSAYFSAVAGDSVTHAGLLNGVTAIANTGNMHDDLSALAVAAGAGGSGQVVYVTGPGRFAAISVRYDIKGNFLPSLAVPEDRIIAIDPQSLVHVSGGLPDITASTAALLHMSDTPSAIVASATTAHPVRSMWQTNSIALSCLLDVGFGKRRSGAVAYMDGISW